MLSEKAKLFGLSNFELATLLSTTEKMLVDSMVSKNELFEKAQTLLDDPVQIIERLKNVQPKIGKKRVNQLTGVLNSFIISKLKDVVPGSIFLKQVKSNELGFRNGIPGKAGSFVLAPKNSIGFFPELSNSITNDSKQISITIMPENETRLQEFVYHNSKYTENDPEGRDEYRIYIRNFINDSILLQPDDIVLITKVGNLMYRLYRVRPSHELYNSILSVIIEHKESRAFSAIVSIAELIMKNINLQDLVPDDIDIPIEPTVTYVIEEDNEFESADFGIYNSILHLAQYGLKSESLETVVRQINLIKRDHRFKKVVIHAYKGLCAISELSITYGKKTNIQACHIIGKSEQGSDNPQNGIALDMNLHWAFDNGLLTISDEYRVDIHPLLKDNPALMRYHGKKIILPEDQNLWPSLEALKHHQTKTFGKFIKK